MTDNLAELNHQPWEKHGRLTVAPDGSRLQHADGTPFDWLGETAWALHQNLPRGDVVAFLDDCVANRFTVIQLMSVNKWALRDWKNHNGDEPYLDDTAWRLNPPYWRHLGWVIDEAAARGLHVLLVYGSPGRAVSDHGPIVRNAAEAYAYGRALGECFADKPNLIWSSGIDVNPDDAQRISPMGIEGWHAMAKGVFHGVTGTAEPGDPADWSAALMTYHTAGARTSSKWFHEAAWLSFNAAQIGLPPTDELIRTFMEDRARRPAKPVVNVEPWYEACDWGKSPVNDHEMRVQAYHSLLAGACGFTYGHHNIYGFDSPVSAADGDERNQWRSWRTRLDAPGRLQMRHLRAIMAELAGRRCEPMPELLTQGPNDSLITNVLTERIAAAASADRKWFCVYSPKCRTFSVNLALVKGDQVKASWFNPRSGEPMVAGAFTTSGEQAFRPMGEPAENHDWLLILESCPTGSRGGSC